MKTSSESIYLRTARLALHFTKELEANGIDVWLEHGSALGAVREGGMIRGDNDLDLGMWQDDWQRFKDMICGQSFSFSPPFPYHFVFEHNHGGETCTITGFDGLLPINISSFVSFDNIRAAPADYGPDTRNKSKFYHHKNLTGIKFEGLDFHISKYAEKYLDYRYQGAGGQGNTWRTPLTGEEMEQYSWATTPCYRKEDEIVACVTGVFDLFHIGHLRILQKSRQLFDKVVAAVHSDSMVLAYKKKQPVIPFEHRIEMVKSCKYVDDVIIAPLPDGMEGCHETGLDFLNENNLDYLVHSYAEEEFLEYHFSSIIKEHRLFLLPQTPDYHTTDLIKKIYERKRTA